MLALAITAGAAAADDSVPVSEPVTPKGASRPSSAPSPGSGQTGGSGQATGIAPSAPAGASAQGAPQHEGTAASASSESVGPTPGGSQIPPAATQHFSLLDPKTWPFSFVPVPEVATDPNQGTTYGILPVLLFNDEHQHIHDIFAPDITSNTIMGPGGTFRYLSYPSEDTQWYATGGLAQRIARRVDLYFATGRAHTERWSFEGRFYFERDPTERFFGIGNQTQHSGQTNYTTEQVYGQAQLGLNLTPQLQVALVEKPRYVRIFGGTLDLPFIGKLYPNLKGLDGGSDIANRLLISYDTRDSPDIPRRGDLLRLFGGVSDRQFLSSVSYTQLGGEVRHYVSFGSRVTLASHLFLQYTPAGNETPFWAMARLGGEDSLLTDQQTLRGYGAGRFVDNNLSLANVEVRTRVYERDIFDTHGIIELAPFLEAGRVFHDATDDPVTRLHPVGGIGFRGIAEPFVVGYLDVGGGGEGAAVFSGINYPF